MIPQDRRRLIHMAAETALVVGLVLLCAFVLRGSFPVDPPPELSSLQPASELLPVYGKRELAAVVSVIVAVYWALQFLGRNEMAFWLLAAAAVLSYGQAVWTHNHIDWYQFFRFNPVVDTSRSQVWDTVLFLTCLTGLVALNHTIRLRRLDSSLARRGVSVVDRFRVVLNETLLVLGLLAAAAVMALLMVSAASTLGRPGLLPTGSTWIVMIVGGGAAFLFICSLVLWFRARNVIDDSIPQTAETGPPIEGRDEAAPELARTSDARADN